MIRKYSRNIAEIVFLLAIVVMGAFFFVEKNEADENVVSQPADIPEIKVPENSTITETQNNISVPILMYHYIRDYNDPTDKIGVNLSVSPEKFKEQINYLKNNGYKTITFFDLKNKKVAPLPEKPIILTFDDGYSDAFDAYKMLKENDQVGVFYIISSFVGRDNVLTTNQIIEMSKNNMEIGSHSKTHPDLTKISDANLKKELEDSKKNLEEIIGKSIISFCYPAGKYNQVVKDSVANSEYLFATTTKSGIAKAGADLISLPRIRITPSDTLESISKKLNK